MPGLFILEIHIFGVFMPLLMDKWSSEIGKEERV